MATLLKQRNGSVMALQKFIKIHLLWFMDYIMIEEILLNWAWESGGIFVQKAEKRDKQFDDDEFVREAKENSQSK